MIGWVTTSRISWVLKNKIEPKLRAIFDKELVNPTVGTNFLHVYFVMDSSGAGTLFFRRKGKTHTIFAFLDEKELDELFSDLQHNIKEITYDTETEEFVFTKTTTMGIRSKEKKSSQKSNIDSYDSSGPDNDFFV